MAWDQIGFDWIVFAHPALMAFVRGQDPYTVVPGFVTPPWMLAMLSPLALLPPVGGVIVLILIALSGQVALCRKFGKIRLALPLALSFPMAVLLWMGQVDGIVLWGLTLGGPAGLLLLSAKPQAAGLVGLIWAMRAWREGGWKKTARLVAPTMAVAAVFALLYPNWLRGMSAASGWAWTTNGFPWSIPLGVAMLVMAVRRDREDWAALATILLAPYANLQSWVGALALLTLSYPTEGAAASLATWLIPIALLARR
jgi:hypothetical protein